MAQYDGSIRIDTSIITKNVRPKVQEIVKSLEEIGKDAEKAREKLDLLDKGGVSHSSKEYKEAQAELQKYVDAYKSSMYKIAEYGRGVSDSLQFDTSKIDGAREKLQSMDASGIDHSSKEYKEAERDLNHLIDSYEQYQEIISEFDSYTKNAFDGFKKLQGEAEKYVNTSDTQAESTDKVSQHINILRADVEEYAKSLKELQSQGKFFGDEEYDKLYLYWKDATDAVKAYQAELNKQTESGQAKIAEQEARAAEKREAAQRRAEEQTEKALQKENARVQKQVENETKLAAKEAERQAKIEAEAAEEQRLAHIRDSAVASNQKIVQTVERIRQLESEIADLKKVNRTEGYSDYEDRIRELSQLKQEVKDYNSNMGQVKENYKKLGNTAKQSFEKINKSAKKSNGFLSTMVSRFKGLALSLLIFNQISKAFNAFTSSIKEGFGNLYNEVGEFKRTADGLKASMLTLKNSFAAAFRPLVEMAIPYIQKAVEWLTVLMDKLGQFIALAMGQKTYTRAVKQTAAALEDAGKAAKGYLSPLDEINQFTPKEDSGGAGASGTMFEEVPVDGKLPGIFEKIAEYAKSIKDIFSQGFWDGLGNWEYRWDSIKNSLKSIKDSLANIWTDPAVLNGADTWAKSVAYMLGSLTGTVASIGLTIGSNFIGGISLYLEQNKERIKGFLVSMFDIWTEINGIFSELFQSIGYVFEAFASGQGQQLTANIIGIFSNAFMGVMELASKLFRDISNIIIQPFVDNKEKFRTALEGLLSVLSEVTGTIKQGIDDTFAKLSEIYDRHFKPFFDSIADGLSDTVGKFMDFWNESVQPILEEWAAGFDKLWKEHIQPALDKFVEMLGDAADFLKAVWENVLKPFIDWLIENVLPVVLPIIDGIVKALGAAFGTIADIAGGIMDIIGGILEFLTGVFTGDWKKAWDGIVKIFDGVGGAIKGIVNGILGFVESLANGVVNAINTVIRALNRLSFDIPSWVPLIGGNHFGFNIPELSRVSIPRLATGTVVPPNREFMAVLGDNKREPEVVSPLSTMKQAVLEAIAEAGGIGEKEITIKVPVYIGDKQVYEATVKYGKTQQMSTGKNPFLLGTT
nr:hypothetical protein [uncultured Acetatifactor sp.]